MIFAALTPSRAVTEHHYGRGPLSPVRLVLAYPAAVLPASHVCPDA